MHTRQASGTTRGAGGQSGLPSVICIDYLGNQRMTDDIP